jgi:hypothetical protein
LQTHRGEHRSWPHGHDPAAANARRYSARGSPATFKLKLGAFMSVAGTEAKRWPDLPTTTAEGGISVKLLAGAWKVLVVIVWTSALLFGLYILAFYAAALATGETANWNKVLPGLYDTKRPAATVGIGVHFAMGGVILVLGSVQFIPRLRDRLPALHRWLGRVYVIAALLAGLGGLGFIVVKGTIGGPVMNLGFGLYGLLMIVAAIQTLRHAIARRLDTHRAWAVRLYALAIGSWLYRMDYGFWLLLTDGVGHTGNFRGAFDLVMAFFFYVPNLLVAELFIRWRRLALSPSARITLAALLTGASGFIVVGTYYFTRYHWGPAILKRLLG